MIANAIAPAPCEVCWCGGSRFDAAPHADYLVCQQCGTAKLKAGKETGQTKVEDESSHLYGAQYWDEHMKGYGYPTLAERARQDLSERGLYWLQALLKYQLPPSRVLEIGCAHGGFVKVLRTAGYAAFGMEMSPQIIGLAKEWFDVSVIQGPIETVGTALDLFDAVVMFDVIEHFATPEATMRAITSHLGDRGVLVLQTPVYENVPGAAWRQFKSPEHTFLFSRAGLRQFLARIGFPHVAEEPALFADDMFVFASRQPFRTSTPAEIEARLTATPDGRIALAMLEMYARERNRSLSDVARTYGAKRLAVATVIALGQWVRSLVRR